MYYVDILIHTTHEVTPWIFQYKATALCSTLAAFDGGLFRPVRVDLPANTEAIDGKRDRPACNRKTRLLLKHHAPHLSHGGEHIIRPHNAVARPHHRSRCAFRNNAAA